VRHGSHSNFQEYLHRLSKCQGKIWIKDADAKENLVSHFTSTTANRASDIVHVLTYAWHVLQLYHTDRSDAAVVNHRANGKRKYTDVIHDFTTLGAHFDLGISKNVPDH
jgi:hypothetical protein